MLVHITKETEEEEADADFDRPCGQPGHEDAQLHVLECLDQRIQREKFGVAAEALLDGIELRSVGNDIQTLCTELSIEVS